MRRRAHWFSCQKCGDYRRARGLDFAREPNPPKKCRCGGDDFHYTGFMIDPHLPIGANNPDARSASDSRPKEK